ncbi:hypothetical protein LCGC14_1364120 [marine sediment metagenome]|uniref:Uncharacterized protein n=1 Tax=marine sediment metagenome TaxID=412755 RepID=A0A0F9KTB7_9ZZZZ
MNNYTGAKQRKRPAEAPPFSFVKVSAAGTVLAKRARPLLGFTPWRRHVSMR